MGKVDRKGILGSVKTEIGLLALIALVVEGAIALLATQVEKTAVPAIIGGMLGILALVIVVAAVSIFVNRRGPAAGTGKSMEQIGPRSARPPIAPLAPTCRVNRSISSPKAISLTHRRPERER